VGIFSNKFKIYCVENNIVRMPRRGRRNVNPGNVLGNSEEEPGGRLVQLRPKTKEIDQAMSEYLMYFKIR